jgi:hypothetical protein
VQEAKWLPSDVKERFISLFANKINSDGEVCVQSDKHRTQHQNLQDAMDRLQEMVDEAEVVPKERELKTELSEHAKLNRRLDKAKHSSKKQGRRGPEF